MTSLLFCDAMQSTARWAKSLCRPNNKITSLWTFSRMERQHFSTTRTGHRTMLPGGGGLPTTALLQKKRLKHSKTLLLEGGGPAYIHGSTWNTNPAKSER
jgi:hypothetical protein